jgi:signal transduction histidine kinase
MRRRILLLVVGMTTLVVLAFAIPLTVMTGSVVGQRADTDVRDEARNVALTVRSATLTGATLRRYVAAQVTQHERPVQVVLPDGTTVGSLPVDEAPPEPRGGRPVDGGSGGPRGDNDDDNPGAQVQLQPAEGGQLATAVADSPDGPFFARVFLSDSARQDGAAGWYLLIGGASAGLLALAVLGGELLTRRITRPLVRTAETARLLADGDVGARAPTDGPGEVAEVGQALNTLAARIDELIAEERETVADLSHRLRTPLTTLRLDAEALHDPAESERIGGRISELERTLTAVIRAARRPQREGRRPACDACAVVGERVQFWSALTEEQGRRADIDLPAAALPVRAAAEDLAAAVDALLENVVAHTPEGTAFSVRLTPAERGAVLEIADEGAGIPEAAEVRGRSDRGSSGLGLDIARRCAEASGGSMTIDRAPAGGARLTLRLGPP